jgi:hypothetical protein
MILFEKHFRVPAQGVHGNVALGGFDDELLQGFRILHGPSLDANVLIDMRNAFSCAECKHGVSSFDRIEM